MATGLFIVLEGIDGSGKTVQALKLSEWVFSNYKGVDSVLLTREPTHSKFGMELRQRLPSTDNPESSKERFQELFTLDREEHVDSIIAPALEKKSIVIGDRYKYSTIAYQSAQGVSTQRIIDDNAGFPIPAITLILNLPVDVGLARTQQRGKPLEIFEKKDFLEKVKALYAKMPQLLPKEKITLINANQSVEHVHADVVNAVKPMLDAALK